MTAWSIIEDNWMLYSLVLPWLVPQVLSQVVVTGSHMKHIYYLVLIFVCLFTSLSVWYISSQMHGLITIRTGNDWQIQAISKEINGLLLIFNIHMKENLGYMSLGQGQDSNTLEKKGNRICFYGCRQFSLSSIFTSMTLHTWECYTPCNHITTHVELGVQQIQPEEMAKKYGCSSLSWDLLGCQVFF